MPEHRIEPPTREVGAAPPADAPRRRGRRRRQHRCAARVAVVVLSALLALVLGVDVCLLWQT